MRRPKCGSPDGRGAFEPGRLPGWCPCANRFLTNHRQRPPHQPGRAPAKGETSDVCLIEEDSPEDLAEKLIQTVTERISRRFGLDPIADIQVLTPMNRGGLGVRALNAELQQRLNGSSEPKVSRFGVTYAPGNKVIQRVNNYDKDESLLQSGEISR